MGQGTLTNAGRALFAERQANNQVLVIDRFLLANIPGLNVDAEENQNEPLPAMGNRVAQLAVTTQGFVNADQVVYSLYMGTEQGDFTFNWVGLLADNGTLVAVRYIDPVEKFATAAGVLGNAMTRNFLVAYVNAQAITNITVQASAWQFHHDTASESGRGLIQVATQAETNTGTNDLKAITPRKGAASYVSKVNNGTVNANTRWADNRQIEIGNSADMLLYHASGANYIRADSGALNINQQATSGLINMSARASNGTMRNCVVMGGAVPQVSLYHNGAERLRTTASGVMMVGNIEAAGNIVLSPGGAFVDIQGLLRQQGERLYSRSLIDLVGCIMFFDSDVPPPGFLDAFGATVSRTTYANLYARIGTRHGAGNGSTTFRLPDGRAEFFRGLDAGRGVDVGRVLGSAQADAMQNILGSVGTSITGSDGIFQSPSGAFGVASYAGQAVSGTGTDSTSYRQLNFDASRVARTATETRSRNLAFRPCICYAA